MVYDFKVEFGFSLNDILFFLFFSPLIFAEAGYRSEGGVSFPGSDDFHLYSRLSLC